jgi:hypothetical protein
MNLTKCIPPESSSHKRAYLAEVSAAFDFRKDIRRRCCCFVVVVKWIRTTGLFQLHI